MEIKIPEIADLTATISQLDERIAEMENKINPKQEWFTLKEACAIKGLNPHTVSSRRQLQPNRGKEDAMIAGRKRWRRETILSWLDVTDSDFKDQN